MHRHGGERRQQQHRESALGDRRPITLVHRPHVGHRHIAIERGEIGAQQPARTPADRRPCAPRSSPSPPDAARTADTLRPAASRRDAPYFTSPTTPTIVFCPLRASAPAHAEVNLLADRIHARASSARAAASLISTTSGPFSSSRASKRRPRCSGIFIVLKYPGVTIRMPALGESAESASPRRVKLELALNSRRAAARRRAAALSTPGTCLQPRDQRRDERAGVLRCGYFASGRDDVEREHVIGREARVHVLMPGSCESAVRRRRAGRRPAPSRRRPASCAPACRRAPTVAAAGAADEARDDGAGARRAPARGRTRRWWRRAIATVNASTRQSILDFGESRNAARRRAPRARACTSTRRPARRRAPRPPSTRLSDRNCCTSRRRPAPSAARTATSRARPCARASSRFATLTHATAARAHRAEQNQQRRTDAADHRSLQRHGDHHAILCWCAENRATAVTATVAIAAFACARSAPVFSRASRRIHCAPRAAARRRAA